MDYNSPPAGFPYEPPIPVSSERQDTIVEHRGYSEHTHTHNPADKFVVPPTVEGTDKLLANSNQAPEETIYGLGRKTFCGLRRKTFWIILSISILLVIGAVVGGVVGGIVSNRNNTPEALTTDSINSSEGDSTNTTTVPTSRTILPGTALAATSYQQDIHVFYQDTNMGLYHVSCSGDCSVSSTVSLISEISDAKLHSPLAAAGGAFTGGDTDGQGLFTEVHLYYLDENNNLREKIWQRSGDIWIDGPLSLNPVTGADSRSQLGVIHWDSGEERRLYYQQSDLYIHEASFSQSGTAEWKPDTTVTNEPVSPGTKIASVWWEVGNTRSIRVYYQANNNSLCGMGIDPTADWGPRLNSTAPVLPTSASLATIGLPRFSIFGANRNGAIIDYQSLSDVWVWSNPITVATVTNNTYPIAATQWRGQDTIWVFYQGDDDSLNFVDSSDRGDTWSEMKSINITTSS